MSIDVVPHPRIDHLVTGLDGQPLRRTDHRGVVWFGGRQAAQTGGMMMMRSQAAAVVTPFWLPDSLAYRSEWSEQVVVSISASVLYVPENCGLADVSARLAVNETHPHASHVLVHLQGAARIPIGVSYDVTVLAPPDAVLPAA
jgi:hypothetical protein